MDFDVEHAAVLLYVHLRHARDRFRQLALVEDAEAAGTLGDEETAIGQERERPWRLEITRNDLGPERQRLGLDTWPLGSVTNCGLGARLPPWVRMYCTSCQIWSSVSACLKPSISVLGTPFWMDETMRSSVIFPSHA